MSDIFDPNYFYDLEAARANPEAAPEKESGFLSNTADTLDRGFEDMQTFMSASSALSGITDNSDAASSISEYFKRAQSKETPEYREEFDENIETYSGRLENMESYTDKGFALFDIVKELFVNPKGAIDFSAEQIGNQAPTIVSAATGAAVGSAVPGIGTGLGLYSGMAAGTIATEAGAKTVELIGDEAAKRGLDPSDPESIQLILEDEAFRSEATKKGLIKGGTVAAIDMLTMKAGGKILTAPQRAADKKLKAIFTKNGIDPASKSSVKKAMTNPVIKKQVDGVYEGLAKKTARVVAAGTIETVGEGGGEYLGEELSGGEGSVHEAVLESLGSLGQSTIQTGAGYALEKSKTTFTDVLGANTVEEAADLMNKAAGSALDDYRSRKPAEKFAGTEIDPFSVLRSATDEKGGVEYDTGNIKTAKEASALMESLEAKNPDGIAPRSTQEGEYHKLREIRDNLFQEERSNMDGTEDLVEFTDDVNKIRSAETELKKASARLAKEGGYLPASDDFTVGRVSAAAKPVVQFLENTLGKQVVFVKDNRSENRQAVKFNGFVVPDNNDVIFINENTDSPHLAILGHELTHVLRRDDAATYDYLVSNTIEMAEGLGLFKEKMGENLISEQAGIKANIAEVDVKITEAKSKVAALQKLSTQTKGKGAETKSTANLDKAKAELNELKSERAKMSLPRGMSNDQMQEEFIADIMGDMLLNPEFYNSLEKKDPEKFGVLMKQVKKLLDRILKALKGQEAGYSEQGFGTEQYIQDIERMREHAATAMKRYADNRATETDTGSPAELQEAQSTDSELPVESTNEGKQQPVVTKEAEKEPIKSEPVVTKEQKPFAEKQLDKTSAETAESKTTPSRKKLKTKKDVEAEKTKPLELIALDVEYETENGETFTEKENAAKMIKDIDSKIDGVKQLIACLKAG